jgi:hypothetical protein
VSRAHDVDQFSLKQRDHLAQALRNGATYMEAASMAEVAPDAFERDWLQGAADLSAGEETELAAWVRTCRSNRARYTATLRAEARGMRGREATAAVHLLEHIEADAEPDPEPTILPHLDTWSAESMALANDLLRSLAGGKANPPRG